MLVTVFKLKAKEKHGSRYDYSKSTIEYKNPKSIIICKTHGEFTQKRSHHLLGSGCPKCKGESSRNRQLKNQSIVLSTFKKARGDIYDYTKFYYRGSKKSFILICPSHGEFKTTYRNYLNGSNCPVCNKLSSRERQKSTLDNFITKARNIHGNVYDYTEVVYVNNKTPIKIKCKSHKYFYPRPDNHLAGTGCPECKATKGERKILTYLSKNKITYKKEFSFSGSKFRYDFFLPDFDVLIEYDGIQHYEPVDRFGGVNGFKIRKDTDEKKTKLAKENNTKLIRIPYTHIKRVDGLLNKLLKIKIMNRSFTQ